MKKILSLFAVPALFLSATAPAAIIQFDPTLPLNVDNQGGFVGTSSVAGNYTLAVVRFNFSGLNPDPSFSISNISLSGDGITGSLSFADVAISGNGFSSTSAVSLSTPISSQDFANSLVSFDLPANVVNPDASFEISIQYRDVNLDYVITSVGGTAAPTYEAVPEPSTYALLVLTAAGLAVYRWRKRNTRA